MTLPEFDIFLSYKSEDAEWVERLWRCSSINESRVWV